MKRCHYILTLAGILSIAILTPAKAEEGLISGTITDASTSRPLSGVSVQVYAGENEVVSSVSTNSDGNYKSDLLTEGLVTIKVSMQGYRNAEETAYRVISGKTTILDFSLQRLGTSIEEIIVSARASTTSPDSSVASTWLDREQIRRAPGTAGDVFRGLNTLPGVSATGEFSDFTVRGRGPRDNLILIDEIPYDRLVHFDQALGEEDDVKGGGRFSIFGQNVVGEAEFQPGTWQAAYGGANGSLLKLSIAEGNEETPFTSIKADLAGAEILYDGPSYVLENTSVLLSLRHYNFGWLFDIIGEETIGTPKLTDLLFKSTTQINDRSVLKVLALYTPERFRRNAKNVIASENLKDVIIAKSSEDAGLLGITLENLVGATGRLNNIFYYRSADANNTQGEAFPELSPEPVSTETLFIEDPIIRLDEGETEFGWRMDYHQLNALGELSFGSRLSYLTADYTREVLRDYEVFVYDQDDFRTDVSQKYLLYTPALYNARLDESILNASVYGDQSFNFDNISIRPGVRLDYDDLLQVFTISPRLQANWRLSPDTRMSLGGGIYYQQPRLLEVAGNPANLALKPERSTQLSLGLEHYIGSDYRMMVELYQQSLDNLVVEGDRVSGLLSNSGKGSNTGIDWLFSRKFQNGWSAMVRYSYVRATRNNNDGTGSFPAEFSRPHLANVTVNYEPNASWAISAQYQIASGRPSDTYVINSDVFSNPDFLRFSREIVQRYTGRYPSFQTLNLRIDYRRNFSALNVIAFIDIINVLGRFNVDEVEFSPRTGDVENEGLDTFPQLGITLEF